MIFIHRFGYTRFMILSKLKKVKTFQGLSDNELQEIIDISMVKKLSKDNILFYEGEVAEYFYVLLTGKLKCYKNDLKGKEIILHYFTQPLLIAEMPSLENITFPATAVVMTDKTEVFLMNRKKFLALLNDNKEFTFKVIKSLTQKMVELEIAINRHLIYDSTTKVCSYILEHPKNLTKSKQKEIASFLNMAPETLSRVLNKLKKMGVLNKDCKLIDKPQLQTLLDF
ncbi:MAG: Unknown protein [uncultured Sulfurovum sp.]|uniref:Transcriptional regulator, Crp/Fnr family n=1 Tax=uncultured Sulfurovum sp. TaxID=269237 RepID=A0A6S6SKK2_9BACT|nr:MAG: Unknown protein [uncultured Sulfurovum sp.]